MHAQQSLLETVYSADGVTALRQLLKIVLFISAFITVISESACTVLLVCLSVYPLAYLKNPNFSIFVHVTCGRGSMLL